MRARMAIRYSNIQVELREVALSNKPTALLQVSPKATVPVLVCPDGTVLDESLDIMHWALKLNDPQNWRHINPANAATNDITSSITSDTSSDIASLISENDNHFKIHLDHYKYADRFPEHSPLYYRQQAEVFLASLERRLNTHSFLLNESASLADTALFPFVRQFAHVDLNWFDSAPYPKLRNWLSNWQTSEIFLSIMHKHPGWDKHQLAITL